MLLLLTGPLLLMRKLGLREIEPLSKVTETVDQTQDVNCHAILPPQLPSRLGHSVRETVTEARNSSRMVSLSQPLFVHQRRTPTWMTSKYCLFYLRKSGFTDFLGNLVHGLIINLNSCFSKMLSVHY